MTREEFDNTKFTAKMDFQVLITGNIYGLIAVSFGEGLIALDDSFDPEVTSWYRCESVELVK